MNSRNSGQRSTKGHSGPRDIDSMERLTCDNLEHQHPRLQAWGPAQAITIPAVYEYQR